MLNKYIKNYVYNSEASYNLFCFPYAGGNASVFSEWKDSLSRDINLYSIQYPGRGSRYKETLHVDLNELVKDIYSEIIGFVDKPLYFFGHSMGALVCYELAHKMKRELNLDVNTLFVSSHQAPTVLRNTEYHKLSDMELTQKLREMKGTPDEVLESQDILNLFLPIIKADFQVCETYKHANEMTLDCPIIALGGLTDKITSELGILNWGNHTSNKFKHKWFDGGHFYLQEDPKSLLSFLNYEILNSIKTS